MDRLKTLWPEIEPLLDQLLELGEAERAARLDHLAAGSAEKRELLEELLRAERDSGELLSRPARLAPRAAAPPDAEALAPGTRVGPWVVVRELGRGGMGAVLLAERADGQYRQQVAIKLVRSDAWHPTARQRFLVEREILARLHHANIARLVDGGVREDDSPWLAMEYVDGRPITAWCDERRLDVRARLRLFRQVCDAVEYAHGMLVVHRDLKPDNIYVTARGEVKLLDFGIAKLIDANPDATMTSTRARVLTPAYAAPEQFLGEPMTAVTDEYQLGLVLYELLTGRRAHGDTRSPLQHQRAVLDLDPRAPSRAATGTGAITMGDGAPPDRETLAGVRSTSAAALARALAGDLDAVVLRALEREPQRRYPSVEAFRRDLEHVLADRPVMTRRASAADRVRKFVRRNRVGVIAGSLAAASLLAGVVGMVLQARVAARERDLARAAERKATAINDFVLRELIESATPERSLGRPLTVAEVLAGASRTVGWAFPDDPLTEAGVRMTLARSYQSLGQPDSALVHAEAARARLAAHAPGTTREALDARALLADLAIDRGEYRAAREAFASVAADQARALGASDPATIRSRGGLGRALAGEGRLAQADSVLRGELTRLDDAREWRLAVGLRGALADVWIRRGRAAAADSLLRDVLALEQRHVGPEHPLVLATLLKRGRALHTDLRFGEATRVLEEAVRVSERVNGPVHPATADAWATLGSVLDAELRHGDAERATRRALEIYRATLGDSHPRTVRALRNLAIIQRVAGHYASADSSYGEAYRTCLRSLGAEHAQTLEALRGLVYLRLDQGREAEARAFALRIRAAYERLVAEPAADPGDLVDAADYLTEAVPADVRDASRAVAFARRAVERTQRQDYTALRALGFAAAAAGDTDRAIASLRDALSLPEGVRSWTAEELLADLYAARHADAEAERFLLGHLRRERELRGDDDRYSAKTMRHLAAIANRTGRTAEARRWLRDALAQLRKTLVENHWEVGRAKSELGALLAGRPLDAEAESLLVQGWRALAADPEVSLGEVEGARARLIAAYAAAGRGHDAATWRQRAPVARRGPDR